MSVNFQDGKWWELSLSFAPPHQWFKIGWDILQPTSKDRTALVSIYLGCVSINFEWGDENWEWDEEEIK